ncbi:MAG: MATE family efflux transporter [Lachnospiraceae bacterium]|nr:MATE family efflux transporter [Lachnospiraceae bacterium]
MLEEINENIEAEVKSEKEYVTENFKENKMGTMPVNRLLLSMSLPMMLSMLVQALYNIVDSIFVAKISEDALTAVSLAFPMQTLMIALGGGMGVGVNALLSKSLGEKDYKNVSESAKNGIFLACINAIIFLAVGLTIVRPFYEAQTDNQDIINYGVDYLTIVCCCSFGIYCQFIFERLLQSTGKTMFAMVTQLVGAVTNLILDPIMIFGYFGCPKMGVSGAALATVIGQVLAGITAIIINVKYNEEIKLDFKGFRPSARVISKIYKVGVPSIIMQSIGSVMTYGMNQILMTFSSTAAAVFGVYFKLQSFIFMPVFGLNNGMVPIIAFNYGAQNRDRLVKTVKLSMVYAIGLMCFGTVIFNLIPEQLLMLFEASDQMLKMGVPALRIISLHFLLAGFCIIGGSVFQALGCAVYSMINSICRQVVVLLPAAWLLSKLGNVNYVWLAFPIAELMSFTMTSIFMVKINRDIISKIGAKTE